ncbi:hypothetical protein EHQ91_10700 [Leptospira biflexa]|uniref:hypothetical protein n=1 Tax=Leptospira biflexa TaxID=172 RepID=UPI001090AEEA|nr:hypothetical protein [Leptospira biflexa]TGM55391.1 hypothetical protein EHQ91_10700 [Leptospira biflexa]
MGDILKNASEESLKAGDRFIKRIKTGIISKNTLPNKSEEYPLDKASENFSAYLESDDFKKLITNQ